MQFFIDNFLLLLPRVYVFLYAGGDLHYQLTQRGTFQESEVRFYAAEILLGLDHMHQRNIVYRDLKVNTPSNIIIIIMQ